MKLLINGLMVACLLVSLATATAFSNTRKSTIAFSDDTKVNGTLVKKGKYEVVFDDQSGELSIFKGAKLIAKTSARLGLVVKPAAFLFFTIVLVHGWYWLGLKDTPKAFANFSPGFERSENPGIVTQR